MTADFLGDVALLALRVVGLVFIDRALMDRGWSTFHRLAFVGGLIVYTHGVAASTHG